MFADKAQIEEALSRVGRRLASTDAGEFALLLCGGSALSLGGFTHRTTRDVDVLGLVKGGGRRRTVTAEPLPTELMQAAEAVARDHRLPIDWLSDAAREVQRLGLPRGILSRAKHRRFGPCLEVFILGRRDQVALKLYAALDRKGGQRHLKDLEALRATRAELKSAAHWLLDRKTSAEFRSALKRVIGRLTLAESR